MAEQKLTLKLVADTSGIDGMKKSIDTISEKTNEARKIEQDIVKLTNERKLALGKLELSIARISTSNLNNALSLGAANASLTAYNKTLEQTRIKLLELNQSAKKSFDLGNLPQQTSAKTPTAAPTGFNFATGGVAPVTSRAPEIDATTIQKSYNYVKQSVSKARAEADKLAASFKSAAVDATTLARTAIPKGFNYATGGITPQVKAIKEVITAQEEVKKGSDKLIPSLEKQTTIWDRLRKGLAGIIIEYRAINAVYNQILNFFKSIPEIGIKLQAVTANLTAIFGTEQGNKNLDFLSKIATKAGQDVLVLQEAYARFAPSAILAGAKQEDVNKSFQNFTEVGTVLHLTTDKVNSLFLALDQMYAKGTVQSEEIKKQLGNVLPGAVEIGAQAMGKSPAAFMEAMKKNEITAREFVPKFSELYRKIFGGPDDSVFISTADKLQSNLLRVKNEFTFLASDIFQSVEGPLNNIVKAFANTLQAVRENLTGISQGIELLSILIGVKLVTSIGTAREALGKMSTAMTSLTLPMSSLVTISAYMLAKLNDLSFGYDKATGFTVAFKGETVTLTSYLETFGIKAIEAVAAAYESVDRAVSSLMGKDIPSLWDNLIPNGKDLAEFKAFVTAFQLPKANGMKLDTSTFVDRYEKALADGLGKGKTGTIFEEAQARDMEKYLRSFSGKSAKVVSEAIAEGKLKTTEEITKALAGTVDIPAPKLPPIIDNINKTGTSKSGLRKQETEAYKDLARESKEYSTQVAADIKQLDTLYQYQAISIEDYFKQKEELQLKDLNQQIAIFEKQKAIAGKFGDSYKVEEFSDKISSAYERIKEAQDSIASNKLEEQFKFNDMLRAVELEYQKFTNDTAGLQAANLSEINTKYKAIEIELISLIEKGSTFAKTALEHVKAVIADELAMKNLASSQEKLNLYSSILKDKEESIRNAREIGLLSEQQATQQLIDARNEYTNIAKKELDITYEIALANKDNAKVMLEFYKQKKAYETNAYPQIGTAEKVINSGYNGAFSSQITGIKTGLTNLDNLKAEKTQAYQQADDNLQYSGIYKSQVDAYQTMLEQKQAADEKYTTASTLVYTSMFGNMFSMGAETFQGLTQQMISMYGANSKEARRAFMMYKAMAISQTIMSTAEGAMKAYAQGGMYGAIGAALVTAMGAVQVAQIASQPMPAAHGGLEYVPKEQTYLLDKGERVLSPKQNKDLTNFMQQGSISKDNSSNKTGNIRIINSIDPSVFHEYLGTDEGEKVVMNIVRRNRETA